MNHNLKSAINFLKLIAMLVLVMGCSGKTSPVETGLNPDTAYNDHSVYESGYMRTEYILNLDSETVSGQIIPKSRDASLDATKIVQVTIDSLEWDPYDRVWDVVFRLYNPTPYACYRPWVVFTELGQNELLNQDHFIWIFGGWDQPPQRAALKECDKASPKLFGAKSSVTSHLVIHWPEGVTRFAPIEFFVDVSFPTFRDHPDIASIDLHRESSLSRSLTVVGRVLDLQSPPQGQSCMDMWVDLSACGGPEKLPLDGDCDNQEKTGVAVCDLDPFATGVATLHVVDWQGYGIEQDFVVGNDAPTCAQGREAGSGLATGRRNYEPIIFQKQSDVDQLWFELDQIGPAPQMSPDEMFVFLTPGPMSRLRESPSRPSMGVTCAYLDPDDDGDGLVIEWRLSSGPDEDCDDVDDVATPFSFVALPAVQHDSVRFVMERAPSTCPDGSCVPYRELASGELRQGELKGHVTLIKIQEELDMVWKLMGATGPVPQLATGEACVVVIDDEQPTTGNEIFVSCVAPSSSSSSLSVDYLLHLPDGSCSVEPIPSTPFTVVAFPAGKVSVQDFSFTKRDVLQRCADDDCDAFKTVSEGDNSGLHVPYFSVLCNNTQLRAFWSLHRPGQAPPQFDFSSRVLAVVCLGDRASTGHYAHVDCARVDDATGVRVLSVDVTENVPGASCTVEPITTSPFVFVALNKSLEWDDASLHLTPVVYECP